MAAARTVTVPYYGTTSLVGYYVRLGEPAASGRAAVSHWPGTGTYRARAVTGQTMYHFAQSCQCHLGTVQAGRGRIPESHRLGQVMVTVSVTAGPQSTLAQD